MRASKDNGICYLLIEPLMDFLHLRSIPLYDNCEKLNGPMVDFRARYCAELVLGEEAACRPPPPSAQVATKVSL